MAYSSKLLADLKTKVERGRREDLRELKATLSETERTVKNLRKAITEVRRMQTQIKRTYRRLSIDVKLGGELSQTLTELEEEIGASTKKGDADRESEMRRHIKRRDKDAQVRIDYLDFRNRKVRWIRQRIDSIYEALKSLSK